MMSLGDYFKVWIGQDHVGPKSKTAYANTFDKYLSDLAKMRVGTFTTRDVRAALKAIGSPCEPAQW